MVHSEETKRKISKKMSGRKLSEETKEKIRVSNTGRRHTEKAKEKIRSALKGRLFSKEHCKNLSESLRGKKLSMRTRERISKSLLGNSHALGFKHSLETRAKMSKAKKGKKLSVETRRKMSELNKGSLNYFWRGGLTSKNGRIRKCLDFNLWREAVFERDNWTCQATGVRGGELHPHHLQNFSQYPELRFAIDNGITLSKEAHKEFHKIYGYRNNTREQMEEYLNSKNCTDEKE